MKSEEIYLHLSQFTNVVELIRAANELKAKGEDEVVINKAVQIFRKELVKASAAITRLRRIEVPDIDKQPVGYLQVNLQALQKPVIRIDGDVITM